jgi:hypothetical protein
MATTATLVKQIHYRRHHHHRHDRHHHHDHLRTSHLLLLHLQKRSLACQPHQYPTLTLCHRDTRPLSHFPPLLALMPLLLLLLLLPPLHSL